MDIFYLTSRRFSRPPRPRRGGREKRPGGSQGKKQPRGMVYRGAAFTGLLPGCHISWVV